MPTNPTSTGPFNWLGGVGPGEKEKTHIEALYNVVNGGKYWTIDSTDDEYYLWYNYGSGEELSVEFQNNTVANYRNNYFTFDTPEGGYYVWFDGAKLGTDPAIGGRTGICVDFNPIGNYDALDLTAGKGIVVGSNSNGHVIVSKQPWVDNPVKDRVLAVGAGFSNLLTGTDFTSGQAIRALRFTNNGFWAAQDTVTSDSEIHYSSDGISWSLMGTVAINFVKDIMYSQVISKYIAVGTDGTNGKIATSIDGISWSIVDTVTSAGGGWDAIEENENVVVVAGGNGTGNTGIKTSTDGTTWTDRTNPIGSAFIGSLAWSSHLNRFVGGNQNAETMFSDDGINWTQTLNPLIPWNNINDIAYGGGTFIAVCENTKSMYSTDGFNWYLNVDTFNMHMDAVAYNEKTNTWVAFGSDTTGGGGKIIYSVDGGANWFIVFSVLNAHSTGSVGGAFVRQYAAARIFEECPYVNIDASTLSMVMTNMTFGNVTDPVNSGVPVNSFVVTQGTISDTDPAVAGRTAIRVDVPAELNRVISSVDSYDDYIELAASELRAKSTEFTIVDDPLLDTAKITNNFTGTARDPVDVDSGVTFQVVVDGSNSPATAQVIKATFPAKDTDLDGKYFKMYAPQTDLGADIETHVYFRIKQTYSTANYTGGIGPEFSNYANWAPTSWRRPANLSKKGQILSGAPQLDTDTTVSDLEIYDTYGLNLNNHRFIVKGDLRLRANHNFNNMGGLLRFIGVSGVYDVGSAAYGSLGDVEVASGAVLILKSNIYVEELINNGTIYLNGYTLTTGVTPTTRTTLTWTGAFDSDWNDPFNWSVLDLPDYEIDVVIPDVAIQPVMNINGECHDLTCQTNAALNVNGRILSIYGDCTLDATNSFNNTGGGTVKFSGITHLTSNGNDLDNTEVAYGAFLILEDNCQVNNLVNDGTIYTQGYTLTIDGTSSGIGSTAINESGTTQSAIRAWTVEITYDHYSSTVWRKDTLDHFFYDATVGTDTTRFSKEHLREFTVENVSDGSVVDATDGDMSNFTSTVLVQGIDSGVGVQPPDNINFGDILESIKINEIKDNADFLYDNTEACFNEKINLYSDRDSIRRDVAYDDQYALRRDTVNTQLNATNRDANLSTVWTSANTGRRDVAYTTRRDTANRRRCDEAGSFRTRARSNDWSGANNSYWANVGAGCSGYHTTYHGGVDNTDRGIRDASEYLTFNASEDGTEHSARHNIFCSILT